MPKLKRLGKLETLKDVKNWLVEKRKLKRLKENIVTRLALELLQKLEMLRTNVRHQSVVKN